MKNKAIAVAGIGTGIGKTFISAILCEALKADYWKPVQAGNLEHTDTDEVYSLISNTKSVLHPEAFRLTQPMSPHAAAKHDNIEIQLNQINLPSTNNSLIIELAGGLMVPLNDRELNIDLLKQWDVPVMLISKNYLGSINHSLLSVQALKQYDIKTAGIIFNGNSTPSSEELILQYSGLACIGHIKHESIINKATVLQYAENIKMNLETYLP